MKVLRVIKLITILLLVILASKPAAADLFNLCKFIDCSKFLGLPKITGGFGFVTPGGSLLIFGSGFGTSEGKAYIKFPIENKTVEIWQIGEWAPKGIGMILHDSIAGVRDQQAKLWVVTANNVKSNEWTVNFTATKDVKLLTYCDPVVKTWCSDEADYDWCNGQEVSYGFVCGLVTLGLCGCTDGPTLCARHETCFGWADDGTDEIQASLKNGWVFDTIDFQPIAGNVKTPNGFAPDTTWTKVTVDWDTDTPDDIAMYNVFLTIKGPMDVPH